MTKFWCPSLCSPGAYPPLAFHARVLCVFNQFKEVHLEKDRVDSDGNKIPFDYDTIDRTFRFYFRYVQYALRDNNFYSGQCFVWRVFTFSISGIINTYTVTSTGNASIALLFYFVLLWEVIPNKILSFTGSDCSRLYPIFCYLNLGLAPPVLCRSIAYTQPTYT